MFFINIPRLLSWVHVLDGAAIPLRGKTSTSDQLIGKQDRDERDGDQAAKKDHVSDLLGPNAQCCSTRPADREIGCQRTGQKRHRSTAYSSACDEPCFDSASLTSPIGVAHTPIIVPDTGRMCDARLSLRVRIVIRLDMRRRGSGPQRAEDSRRAAHLVEKMPQTQRPFGSRP